MIVYVAVLGKSSTSVGGGIGADGGGGVGGGGGGSKGISPLRGNRFIHERKIAKKDIWNKRDLKKRP